MSKRLSVALALGFFLAAPLAGCEKVQQVGSTFGSRVSSVLQPQGNSAVSPSAGAITVPIDAQAALTALDALPVKGRAPMTGYSRSQFGPAWTDDNDDAGGHNGCDTRDDILARDLTNLQYKDNKRCVVLSGILNDPYTGKIIDFRRGPSTSAAVQIDHMVPLGNAWVTGAQQISARARQNLANDPINLMAVDGPANEQKSDGDAATWLPPNKGFRCAYVARQVQVKTKYGLWVTPPEKAAIERVLSGC